MAGDTYRDSIEKAVIVEKGGKFYACGWISAWLVKCGNCFKGALSPYFIAARTCRVCGARIRSSQRPHLPQPQFFGLFASISTLGKVLKGLK